MAIFTVDISEAATLAGITAARQAHNAALAPSEPPIADDAAYVQFVMTKAAESYARQYST